MSAWTNSTRRDRLPPDWAKIRLRIMRRDNRECQWRKVSGQLCLQPANQVDHIRAGDDHGDANLQLLCEYHHGKKSGGEGGRAAAIQRAQHKHKFRRTEDHPGLL